jgi:hypothetical protein
MKKNQEDTLNMLEATNSVLQTHNAVWTGNVPFSAAVTQFEAGIDAIENLRDQQDTDISGIAQDKENKRRALEEQTFTAGKILAFYASTVNNRELREKVNFTKSALINARDNELPGMSQQVHQEAVANAAAVLPFGLTAAMTTALGTALDDFVDYISKPRAAESETSAATEQLPVAFEATTTLLEEQLDAGMELYRVSDPDFYAQYHNARIIVNSPTLKRALEVHFRDSVTLAPVNHVNVIVDGTISRRSSQNGNIRVQSLSEGEHALSASLPGYATAGQHFNVITGETTKITIDLVRA